MPYDAIPTLCIAAAIYCLARATFKVAVVLGELVLALGEVNKTMKETWDEDNDDDGEAWKKLQ